MRNGRGYQHRLEARRGEIAAQRRQQEWTPSWFPSVVVPPWVTPPASNPPWRAKQGVDGGTRRWWGQGGGKGAGAKLTCANKQCQAKSSRGAGFCWKCGRDMPKPIPAATPSPPGGQWANGPGRAGALPSSSTGEGADAQALLEHLLKCGYDDSHDVVQEVKARIGAAAPTPQSKTLAGKAKHLAFALEKKTRQMDHALRQCREAKAAVAEAQANQEAAARRLATIQDAIISMEDQLKSLDDGGALDMHAEIELPMGVDHLEAFVASLSDDVRESQKEAIESLQVLVGNIKEAAVEIGRASCRERV